MINPNGINHELISTVYVLNERCNLTALLRLNTAYAAMCRQETKLITAQTAKQE